MGSSTGDDTKIRSNFWCFSASGADSTPVETVRYPERFKASLPACRSALLLSMYRIRSRFIFLCDDTPHQADFILDVCTVARSRCNARSSPGSVLVAGTGGSGEIRSTDIMGSVKGTVPDSDVHDIFWSLVYRHGPLPNPSTGLKSRCWIWTGGVTDQGYGRFKAGATIYQVSRYAWRDKGKPDPGKLTVSSCCGNKLCVRHLRLRSRTDVMASIPKLPRRGEESHLARLTSRQVLATRKLMVSDLLPGGRPRRRSNPALPSASN